MKDRRTASTALSAKVIEFLRRRGHSQAEMARMLHVTEGFVSLVKQRQRSLTLDHLELLSMKLAIPLGAMLLAVSKPTKKLTSSDRKKLTGLERLMLKCDEVRAALIEHTKTPRRKSA